MQKSQQKFCDSLEEHERLRISLLQRKHDSLQQLRDEQAQEMADAEEFYSPENIPPKYSKFSNHYLNMRTQEKFLKSCKRYNEADEKKKDTDALEKIEIEEQHARWKAFGDNQKSVLMTSHEQKYRYMELDWDLKIAKFETDVSQSEENLDRRIKAVNNKISLKPLPLDQVDNFHHQKPSLNNMLKTNYILKRQSQVKASQLVKPQNKVQKLMLYNETN